MEKKQLIMEKALELFAKQGFEATSVQQITEQCGISKGAFYLSFKSKDELIFELIDYFTKEVLSEIDYLVRNTEDPALLYKFYKSLFESFQKHADFTKVFLKEQLHTLNEKFIHKMHSYEKSFDKLILSILARLYGDHIKNTKYDLMYSIKGLLNAYSHFLLFCEAPADPTLLARSLVEKTNILAEQITIPYITNELTRMFKGPLSEEPTKEHILTILEEKLRELEDPIEKESVFLLKQDIVKQTFRPAIIKGLLENIAKNPRCKWIAYLLRNYYNL